MKINVAEFIAGAVSLETMPNLKMPEIAFAGRSNVGKSSLINNLVRMKNLARTSVTPGKTQQINFFNINNDFLIADLPGIGYATVSKIIRKEWQDLILSYIDKRETLKLVIVLSDSRHDPMEADLALIERLENSSHNYVIVLTKTDKISQSLINERVVQVKELTAECKFCADIIPHSSINGTGRANLLAVIKKYI